MIGMDWKKKVATTLALTSALLLGACAGGTEEATDSSAASSTASADAVHIGILQILEHESLSAARTGFLEVLEEAGYVEGDNLIVDYQNAQGDQANLQSMAERLAGNNDLILAISTPASQAIANAE
ncbi:MAG TPA: ABC transporter substrate binding protein, partial [Trichococcus sp.]|nr:ABC transporter substrate binding protein [Trichococcus sp.]